MEKLIYWGIVPERKMTWLHELACRYNRLRLVKELKDSGIWDEIDRFWIEAQNK